MIATVESTVPQNLAPESSVFPSTPPKLPPSERDFNVYRFVKFECNSTREAAHEFRISQTRVRQVIARVVEFLLDSVPRGPETDDEQLDQRLVVAEQLARAQLEYLYERAIKAFEDTHHEDIHGNLLPGKICYLSIAARITLWMSKVPVQPLPVFRQDEEEFDPDEPYSQPDLSAPAVQQLRQEMLAEIEKAEAAAEIMSEQAGQKVAVESERIRRQVEAERQARRERRAIPSAARIAPPNAECSVAGVSRGEFSANLPQPESGSDVPETTCRSLAEIKAEARRNFLRSAQAEVSLTLESPASGDDESPAADPLYARTPLNRKERRARQRRLERALAKR